MIWETFGSKNLVVVSCEAIGGALSAVTVRAAIPGAVGSLVVVITVAADSVQGLNLGHAVVSECDELPEADTVFISLG